MKIDILNSVHVHNALDTDNTERDIETSRAVIIVNNSRRRSLYPRILGSPKCPRLRRHRHRSLQQQYRHPQHHRLQDRRRISPLHSSVQSRSPSPTAETLGEGHHAISLVETSVHSGETKISDTLRPEAPTPKLFTRAIFNINLLSFDDIFISVGIIADHT